jgi:hypothetical protein
LAHPLTDTLRPAFTHTSALATPDVCTVTSVPRVAVTARATAAARQRERKFSMLIVSASRRRQARIDAAEAAFWTPVAGMLAAFLTVP